MIFISLTYTLNKNIGTIYKKKSSKTNYFSNNQNSKKIKEKIYPKISIFFNKKDSSTSSANQFTT